MTASSDRRVLLGEITTVHGVKGEVVIRSYTADPLAVADYGPLSTDGSDRTFVIDAARATPKGVVARVAGVSDRNAAEALRGVKLYVSRDAMPEAEDGSFYFMDLVGLSTVDVDGQEFGKITAVHNFGAGDIIEVTFVSEGKSTSELVPFTDEHVPNVDIAAGRATVLLPAQTDDDGDETGADAAQDGE
jgi:16S rRNA processing protein RimM